MYVAGRAAQLALKHGMDVSTRKDIFKSNLDAEILKNKNSKLGSGSSNQLSQAGLFRHRGVHASAT
jgi:hypothetical protein